MGGQRHEQDDDLPLKLGPCSNGEYVPVPHSPVVAEAVRRTREAVYEHSRRLGVSRRSFLRSAGGTAAMLMALGACTKESAEDAGEQVGGQFDVPETAPEDTEAAREALGGDGSVFDVQTHFLEYDGPSQGFGSGFPQADCGLDDPDDCYSIETYLGEIFLRSETAMAVVSAIPVVADDDPLSMEDMQRARRTLDALCEDERLLLHGRVRPTIEPLPAVLDEMSRQVDEYPVSAWKAYTHAAGPGWWLDDHDPSVPLVGDAVLDHARELGVTTFCVHKGLGGDNPFLSPGDIGPAAARHPDIDLVVYHSGYENEFVEGPYDDSTEPRSVDRLVATVADAGIEPNQNVYAELGSTWWLNMRDPTAAAHLLGKLLLAVGEDNVLWGTDSIWYGSPQDQIEAFRAFEITEPFQDRYGYPALTPELKAKILGGNAARLYGVDLPSAACDFDPDELAASRVAIDAAWTTHGPETASAVREHVATHGWA
ncbi:MAG: amidohydrolase family protein [Acidimicrobiia bacterium]